MTLTPVMTFHEAEVLDDKGRCCGRKPIVYKGGSWRSPAPQRFCCRCDRSYGLNDPNQIPNWAYEATEGGFLSRSASG